MIACAAESGDREAAPSRVVMVVEGEVLARWQLAQYLRATGFTVIEASNAVDAVGILVSQVTVDLVFIDMQTPGTMDGLTLARWIEARHPGLPMLFASGDHEAKVDDGVPDGQLVPKPYIFRHVEQRIRRLLGEADNSDAL